jgi:hypothetical protein
MLLAMTALIRFARIVVVAILSVSAREEQAECEANAPVGSAGRALDVERR